MSNPIIVTNRLLILFAHKGTLFPQHFNTFEIIIANNCTFYPSNVFLETVFCKLPNDAQTYGVLIPELLVLTGDFQKSHSWASGVGLLPFKSRTVATQKSHSWPSKVLQQKNDCGTFFVSHRNLRNHRRYNL